ncbi:unnamed protein product [Ophioblennius macclurei]
MDFTIRAANVDDCKDIMRMISELTEHDGVSDQLVLTQKDLEQDGFSKNPFFHVVVAEVPENHKSTNGNTKIGYALYYYSYSTWKGRSVHMTDLYVMPEFRGEGIGKALMSKVTQLGMAAGCKQLEFIVKDTNKSAMDFYLNRGCFDATEGLGYHCMLCEGEAMEHLAQP